MISCICRNHCPVAQLIFNAPHVECRWQSLYFNIGTIQFVRNHGRVYLITILVASVLVDLLAGRVELCMDSTQSYNGE